MLCKNQPEQMTADDVLVDAKPACVALVAVIQTPPWSPAPLQAGRANSMFVTHLIASAEHVPQTRSLRRATPADAQTAYRAHQHQVQGVRTRQII
jgi:hypothetical protein